MKLTESRLKQMIREEIKNVLAEAPFYYDGFGRKGAVSKRAITGGDDAPLAAIGRPEYGPSGPVPRRGMQIPKVAEPATTAQDKVPTSRRSGIKYGPEGQKSARYALDPATQRELYMMAIRGMKKQGPDLVLGPGGKVRSHAADTAPDALRDIGDAALRGSKRALSRLQQLAKEKSSAKAILDAVYEEKPSLRPERAPSGLSRMDLEYIEDN